MTLRPGAQRAKQRWLVLAFVASAALFAFGPIALATLDGSGFDAADGNLTFEAGGETKDWATVGIDCPPTPVLGCAIDLPTGADDDSFGNGTKEDSPIPSVVDGSIPNNKSDLTRFYVYNEKVGQTDFLYLAWERVQEPSGTTNMDFEFNQSAALSANGVTPVRTAYDVLIKYDLAQGGTTPVLGYHVWVTAASAAADDDIPNTAGAACEASHSFPCWGTVKSLSGFFEGSINTASTTDPIPPDADRTLSARTFGEAAINLTDSDILPGGGACTGFGSAYLKSRSSDAFTAAVKDFIAPISVNISNCGHIIVDKVTQPAGHAQSFAFSLTGPGSTNESFSLTDAATPADYEVQAGTGYSVTETVPSGWTQVSAICSDGSAPTNISVSVGETVTCTITNRQEPTLTVVKHLNPTTDTGKFNLQIDGSTAGTGSNVGHNGTTGAVQVSVGAHTVSEAAGTGTDLADYTSAITGDCASDGTITLAAGDNKTCTITNTRRPTLTIIKLLNPTTDSGVFNLFINGTQRATDVGHNGTTGTVYGVIGANTFSESAGTGTTLLDYTSAVSGTGCGGTAAAGTVTLAAGENKTCTITNTRRPKLTIVKVLDPTNDSGKFNLSINGTTWATDVGHNGTTGSQYATIGANSFAEAAGTGTSLSSYISTVSGTGCGGSATAGTVTLAAGDNKTCTITNTRKPTLTVIKDLNPSEDSGKFNLQIDNVTAGTGANVGDGGTTGAQVVSIGAHSVRETAGTGTNLNDYTTTIGGDCAADGSVTLAAGQNKTCTITNTRRTFTVIVLVCEGSDLYKSNVTVDGVTKSSFGSAPSGFTDAQLCALTAARYTGLYTGDHPANVNVGFTELP
ncbi:MAG TPA: hypothetical protein VFM19_10080 [Candidatus Limnocylindria bacterium]|nr:hypothetical protein [Candidatus Limnocylindria bacterium]